MNDLAIATTLQNNLGSLEERAAALKIVDQQSYTAAANLLVEAKGYVKNVDSKLGPGIDSAKQHLDFLKNQRAGYVEPVKKLIDAVTTRCQEWAAAEKRAAEAEAKRRQDEIDRAQKAKAEEDRREAERMAAETKREAVAKINSDLKAGLIGKREAAKRLKEAGAEEEAAKQTAAAVAEEQKAAPPPTVRVAPSVPTVAGIKNQTYYYATVEKPEELIARFVLAAMTRNEAQAAFLKKFITVNDTEVSKFARETKDSDKVMAMLPGVKAWSKG